MSYKRSTSASPSLRFTRRPLTLLPFRLPVEDCLCEGASVLFDRGARRSWCWLGQAHRRASSLGPVRRTPVRSGTFVPCPPSLPAPNGQPNAVDPGGTRESSWHSVVLQQHYSARSAAQAAPFPVPLSTSNSPLPTPRLQNLNPKQQGLEVPSLLTASPAPPALCAW